MLEERVKPLSEDVAEFLARRAVRVPERVVPQLRGGNPGTAEVPVHGVLIAEQPVLVVNVREEAEGFRAVYCERGAADENVLKLPVSRLA